MADLQKVIHELEDAIICICPFTKGAKCEKKLMNDALALLKAQERRHALEVHNIGNVDIPDGVTEAQFYAVMNNVVAALEHTDRGESWPYEEDGYEIEYSDDKRAFIKEWLSVAPTVDAAPVKHGIWVHHKGGFSDHYDCTVCGKDIVLTKKWMYCPNCGARMDGEEDAPD